jgi:hypothetical protein
MHTTTHETYIIDSPKGLREKAGAVHSDWNEAATRNQDEGLLISEPHTKHTFSNIHDIACVIV